MVFLFFFGAVKLSHEPSTVDISSSPRTVLISGESGAGKTETTKPGSAVTGPGRARHDGDDMKKYGLMVIDSGY